MAKILHIRHPSTRTPTECCYCALYPHTLTRSHRRVTCCTVRMTVVPHHCSLCLFGNGPRQKKYVRMWQKLQESKFSPKMENVCPFWKHFRMKTVVRNAYFCNTRWQSIAVTEPTQQQQHQRPEQQNWEASVTWSANYQTSKLKTGQINDGRTDGENERQTHSPARQSVNEKYLKIQIETKTKLKWYKNKTKTKKHSSSQKKYLLRSLYARRSSNLFFYTTASLRLHSSYVERRSYDQFGK